MNEQTVKSGTRRDTTRLFCTQCSNVVEFMHPKIKKLQLEVCEQNKFTATSSMMLFSGVCRGCLLKTSSISKS